MAWDVKRNPSRKKYYGKNKPVCNGLRGGGYYECGKKKSQKKEKKKD